MKKIISLLFIFAFSFSICLDRSLLQHDFYKDKDLDSYSLPYISYYDNGTKKLIFAASYHQTGIHSESFQMVKMAVDAFEPKVVILEGIPTYAGLNYPGFVEVGQKHFADGFAGAGESIYALHLACQNRFSYIGGEPDDRDILQNCLSKGYSLKDVLGFYLVRQIPQWKREGKQFEQHARDFIQTIFEIDLSLDDFFAWYEEKTGQAFHIERITDFSTMPMESGSFLQQISWDVTRMRDEHLQRVIESMISQYDRVLVVYGGAHDIIHRKALSDYFGPPRFFDINISTKSAKLSS